MQTLTSPEIWRSLPGLPPTPTRRASSFGNYFDQHPSSRTRNVSPSPPTRRPIKHGRASSYDGEDFNSARTRPLTVHYPENAWGCRGYTPVSSPHAEGGQQKANSRSERPKNERWSYIAEVLSQKKAEVVEEAGAKASAKEKGRRERSEERPKQKLAGEVQDQRQRPGSKEGTEEKESQRLSSQVDQRPEQGSDTRADHADQGEKQKAVAIPITMPSEAAADEARNLSPVISIANLQTNAEKGAELDPNEGTDEERHALSDHLLEDSTTTDSNEIPSSPEGVIYSMDLNQDANVRLFYICGENVKLNRRRDWQ